MSKDMDVAEPVGDPPSPKGPSPDAMLAAINGVLISISALYLASKSVLVTAIGAVMAIVLGVIYLFSRR